MNITLYGFEDPIGHPDTKVGVTTNAKHRLGVYQNSYSSRTMAQFDFAYYGRNSDIKAIERVIKHLFYKHIKHSGRGRSEWIWNHTSKQMEAAIDKIIAKHHFLVTKIPSKFLPINLNNANDYMDYLETL